MPHFFLKLDMNDQEKAMMQEHFLYWKRRQDCGDVLVFGPVLDPEGPYGMGIVSLTDESRGPRIRSRRPGNESQCRICLRNLSDARGHA